MWRDATAESSPEPGPATPSQAVWCRVSPCVRTPLMRIEPTGADRAPAIFTLGVNASLGNRRVDEASSGRAALDRPILCQSHKALPPVAGCCDVGTQVFSRCRSSRAQTARGPDKELFSCLPIVGRGAIANEQVGRPGILRAALPWRRRRQRCGRASGEPIDAQAGRAAWLGSPQPVGAMCTVYQVDSGCAAALIASRVGEIATGRLRSALGVGAMPAPARWRRPGLASAGGGAPASLEYRRGRHPLPYVYFRYSTPFLLTP